VSITNNSLASNGNPAATDHIAYIQSYASSIRGWRWSENRLTQWKPRIIDFAAGITELQLDEAGVGISNLWELNNQNVTNNYNPIALSNLRGAGLVKMDDWSMMGMPEQIASFKNNPSDVTNLTFTSNVRGSQTGGNVTQTDIPDSQGGTTAATFTYGADEGVILISSIETNGIQGKVLWIEFEVKKSAATPLEAIQLEIIIQNHTSFYSLSLDDNWQNIRIPFIYSSDASTSGDVTFRLTPTLFLDVGVADSFDIGRKVIYHSSTPVPYSTVEIT
jgi:hypothetical protein